MSWFFASLWSLLLPPLLYIRAYALSTHTLSVNCEIPKQSNPEDKVINTAKHMQFIK